MSYIEPSQRELFDELLFEIGERIESPSQLNYVISKLAKICLLSSEEDGQVHNAIHGALAGAAQLFYLSEVFPYESARRNQYGDFFDSELDDEHRDGDR